MVSEILRSSMTSPNNDMKAVSWEIYVEKAGIWGIPDFTHNGFVNHINTTKDTTDYLWQTTRFISKLQKKLSTSFFILSQMSKQLTESPHCRLFVDENEQFLTDGNNPMLLIESKGHALHAFVNGILQGYMLKIHYSIVKSFARTVI